MGQGGLVGPPLTVQVVSLRAVLVRIACVI
jgi:hypothetical protein